MFKDLEKIYTVKESETAEAIGSGGLPVLSTPNLIAYMESTAMQLLEVELDEMQTSVGIEINVKHSAPTAVGKVVTVKVKQTEQDIKVYTYEIEAYVDDELIGKAEHKRAIVDIEKFMNKVK